MIFDDQQRVLITQRPLHATLGGLWEFPGGKLEGNESAIDALTREVREEVGLVVEETEFLGEINQSYAHHTVSLQVYCVKRFKGNAQILDGQIDLRWIEADRLNEFQFPEANQAIIQWVTTDK